MIKLTRAEAVNELMTSFHQANNSKLPAEVRNFHFNKALELEEFIKAIDAAEASEDVIDATYEEVQEGVRLKEGCKRITKV